MKYASHFSNILFVVETVDERACTEEKYCLEECVGADVKESELGLVESNGYYY